jgi:hypothetical protein
MSQGPAKHQGNFAMPINDIGANFTLGMLRRLSKESLKPALDALASDDIVRINLLLAEHADATFMSLARLEGVNDELLLHCRSQMMTLRSVFIALAEHGMKQAKGEHALTFESASEDETAVD